MVDKDPEELRERAREHEGQAAEERKEADLEEAKDLREKAEELEKKSKD